MDSRHKKLSHFTAKFYSYVSTNHTSRQLPLSRWLKRREWQCQLHSISGSAVPVSVTTGACGNKPVTTKLILSPTILAKAKDYKLLSKILREQLFFLRAKVAQLIQIMFQHTKQYELLMYWCCPVTLLLIHRNTQYHHQKATKAQQRTKSQGTTWNQYCSNSSDYQKLHSLLRLSWLVYKPDLIFSTDLRSALSL